jgi:hypothetical protein
VGPCIPSSALKKKEEEEEKSPIDILSPLL